MNQSNLLTVRVAGVMNRQAVVLHAGRTLPCLLSGRLLRQKDSLAVGDRAEAEVLGGGQYRLTRILPRTSALRRPSRRGSGDALLAANADFVLAVCAAPSLLRAFALPEWALEAARAAGAVTIGSILSDFSREDGPARYRDGEQVAVAGVISTYKTRTTRNNTLMAYVNLEDDTASMELLCFSRVLNESGGYIRENSAILVTGKISVRDEKEPQLMVDTIRPMGELDGKERPAGQRLYLRLPCREDPRLRKVKLALSFFPGESQAVLYFEDCKKRVGTRCQIHPALVEDLKERLGGENVVVK